MSGSYPPDRVEHALRLLREVQEEVHSLREEVLAELRRRDAGDADQSQRLTQLDARATQIEASFIAARAELMQALGAAEQRAQQAITERVELEVGRLRAARTATLTGSGMLLVTVATAIVARLLGIDLP